MSNTFSPNPDVLDSLDVSSANSPGPDSPRGKAGRRTEKGLRDLLLPLASLRLTVALFAFAIFLVMAGTLAQWRKDIWQVVDEYFRVYFAFVEFQDLAPRTLVPWFPDWVKGGFYAPGGWLVGGAMFVNLLAAHSLRFTVQVRGTRLLAGLGVLALGIFSTAVVVSDSQGMSGLRDKPFDWSTLWLLCKTLLVLTCFGGGYAYTLFGPKQTIERWTVAGLTAAVTALTGWLLAQGGEFRLGDSSMRILWQLIQGTVASLILLGGCWMLFQKRAGIVLLHGGILLMMANEVVVHQFHHEAQITLREGETRDYVEDNRSIELALVDRSDEKEDKHVAIPKDRLFAGAVIAHPELPVDLKIVEFLRNSRLRERGTQDKTPATLGTGLKWMATPQPVVTGTDGAGKIDLSAAYVELLKKGTQESLGTVLVSLRQSLEDVDETFEVDGKKYGLSLRFPRAYRSYSVHLIDVRKDDYVGTNTPRNYSSDVRVVDSSRQVDREVKIWMNNPLRFAGETFYQSSYDPGFGGVEVTTLQVVSNAGWMIPYVSCMIVATGMLAQFLITLSRFLGRRERDSVARLSEPGQKRGLILPLAVIAVSAIWPVYALLPKAPVEDTFDFATAGQIPIVYEGRIKPLDALARNALRVVAEGESVLDPADPERKKRVPAIQWLLDTISGSEKAAKYEVVRVRHPDAIQALKLPKRSGWRYSMGEIASELHESTDKKQKQTLLEYQAQLADELGKKVGAALLSSDQKTIIRAHRAAQLVMLLVQAFDMDRLPELPEEKDFVTDPQRARSMAMLFQRSLERQKADLAEFKAPLAVPVFRPVEGDTSGKTEVSWQPYSTSYGVALVQARFLGEAPDEATLKWNELLVAYRKGDFKKFNLTAREYLKWIEGQSIPEYNPRKTAFEAAFNTADPFLISFALYFVVTILALFGWLLGSPSLGRAAFWMTAVAFVVHTLALAGRMYISGRPPVTNLYSSAVFIGWGTVLLGLVFELIYKRGVGVLLAGMTGLSSLQIAYVLTLSGDTFTVLQAVLDTQFWLATHVVTVTLGYSTTFVAGFFGILYVLRRTGRMLSTAVGYGPSAALSLAEFKQAAAGSGPIASGLADPTIAMASGKPAPDKDAADKDLARMIYGSLCFALFFSFVGTVLGGLWADDSWGRFWGWDPKENGALVIVLWNALILHARWGAMIKDRGLALLAVAGNVTTSWSWFGVNELGIGLHSYGFTEGVLTTLGLFAISQVVLIGLGLIPQKRTTV